MGRMKEDLRDVKSMKSGTDYLVIKIPKSLLKKLPDGYFFMDLEIKEVRGGKFKSKKEVKLNG